jgi:small conductance mechanosensitive channel
MFASALHLTILLTLAVPLPADTVPPDTFPAPPLDEEQLAAAVEGTRPVQELLAIYRRMDGLRDVRILLDEGILELRGSALTAEDRDRAGELAEQVAGVAYVDNRMEVERSLAKRMAPAAERFREKGTAFIQFLPVLVVGLLILALTGLAAVGVGRPAIPFDWITRNPFANNLLRHAARTVVLLTGVLLALELLGATALVGAVLGTAGLAGLAVGFAFRDIVENYLAGVILSLRQPFAPQDHIEIGGHEGRIVRLTGRETVLMTLDGNHVRIPNSTVFKGVMTNFTRNPRRRFLVRVGIAPWEDVSRALEVGKDTLRSLPGVLATPAVSARVQELGDSSVDLRFAGWVDQTSTDFGKVRSEAIRAVKEAFEDAGVATPPPEYGVRILSDEEGRPEPGPDTAAPAPVPRTRTPAEPDVSPDTTIEEEITRELETSTDENLLTGPEGSGPPRPG